MTPSHRFAPQPSTTRTSFGKTAAGWVAAATVNGVSHAITFGFLPRKPAMRAFSDWRKQLGLNP